MRRIAHILIAVPYFILGLLTICCWPIVGGCQICEAIWEGTRD